MVKAKSKPKAKSNGHRANGLAAYRPQRVNANNGKPMGLKLISDSIQRDGYSAPMVAAADGELFIGSKRHEAVSDVLPAEPIIVKSRGDRPIIHIREDIPSADDPRARRLGVADNAIAHMDYNPDGEILAALAAEDDVLKRIIEADDLSLRAVQEFAAREPVDAEPQLDRAEELRKKWKVKTGQLWVLGDHRLICGDCTDRAVVERVMNREKANCTITDPPYNVGIKYTDATNDKRSLEDYRQWTQSWIRFSPKRLILSVGIQRLVWWDTLISEPQWIIAWIKRNGQGNTKLGGTNKWDAILIYNVKPDGGIDIIELNNDYSEGLKSNGNHPTAKPLELWKILVNRFSEEHEIIYEPFSGSGTTLIACENLNRRCRAVEIAPGYVAVTLQRYQDATGKTPELLD